jgi:hypothetical protein
VLESPLGAARPISRGVVLQAIFGMLVGMVAALVLALFREKARLASDSRSAELDEFRALRAQAVGEWRRVLPWRRGGGDPRRAG